VSTPTGRNLAWSWVDHLRDGGTSTWREWQRRPEVAVATSTPGDAPLPGAAQLELVRLLATRRSERRGTGSVRPAVDAAGFGALADRTFTRSGPGRGMAELPLALPGDRRRGVGPAPVDPGDVPAEELVRVGVGLLADLLTETPRPTAVPDRPTRRRPWARSFRLVGAPTTAATVRAALAASGFVEGGRSPRVVVLSEPVDVLLAQVWSTRVQAGAGSRWRPFVRRWANRDRLPPVVDLAAVAATWRQRVGPARVHVVAADEPVTAAVEAIGIRLDRVPPVRFGAPRASRTATDLEPVPLSPPAVDLVRRLNEVLHVRLDPLHHESVLRDLVPRLPRDPQPLAVPALHRQWLHRQARRLTEHLGENGYAVHGDLDRVAARHSGPSGPRHRDVLDVLLDAVLQVAGSDT
jgi:hypothetical protein